ncbi:hypothetical protein GTP41_01540 [Pseudoduganella sp. DS3]|uniref:Uncharacterized protein n=1 Tax=Pseudoduganella guangdongensis TaxID=2692179 RepID=A0A6N9HBA4_9BURK|nr:hypothetical protein [Pseudoduganella guangdongensis]MYN00774.1 hypothetical protein [Pseudoduganella guangdongensis]
MALDPHKLRLHVFEKTGIKVDVDDPIFALVALNEAVLEEAVERHLARLDSVRPAAAPASANATPGAAYVPPPGARPIPTSHEPFSRRELRLLAAAAGVAILTAALVLIGQAIFRQPAGIPPAKLERALQTLDAPTRAKFEAALAK